jgi:hypothetical protein
VTASLRFALIDSTEGATTADGGKLTPTVLAQMAAILTIYANRNVASEYGGDHLIRAANGPGDLQVGEIPFAILATLDNAPGAIAYHDVDAQAAPDCFDAITLSNSLLGPGNSLLVALAHEIAETIADEGANLLAQGSDAQGYAREACDPVESNSYPISLADGTVGYVSDFVLRSYFVPNHPGPWNWMASRNLGGAAVGAPLQVATGGYQITYASIGAQGQVNGAIRASRLLKKRHPTSRTHRRGVRL